MTTPEIHLHFFKDDDGQRQTWALEHVNDEWTAAYRLEGVDGNPTLVEVRVFPRPEDDDLSRAGLPWVRDPKYQGGVVPAGGVTSQFFRDVHPARARRAARANAKWLNEQFGPEAIKPVLERWGFGALAKEPPKERRRHDDLWLIWFVNGWLKHVNDGSRKPNVDYAKELTEKWGEPVKPSKVRDLVFRARDHSLLSKAGTKTGVGGHLMPRALEILNTAEEQGEGDGKD